MENKINNIEISGQSPNELSAFERFEAFLYSRKFVFAVVFAGIIPMILHSHQLFYNVSPFTGSSMIKNLYALMYAVSFDLTILVFTIHVIKHTPVIYAVFSFIMNILYFDPISDINQENYTSAFTKVFLSGVLAFTGYSYAELFVEKIIEYRRVVEKKAIEEAVNGCVNTDSKQESYPCPECGEEFPTVQARNGHMSVHRKKKVPFVSIPESIN